MMEMEMNATMAIVSDLVGLELAAANPQLYPWQGCQPERLWFPGKDKGTP